MSTMLTAARPSASATSATTPGPVRHRDAQLDHRAAGEIGLEQPPAVVARRVVPGRHRGRVTAGQRRADLAEAAHRVVDRRDQRVRVGEVDVAPDRGRWRPRRAWRRGSSARSAAAARILQRAAPPGRRGRSRARAAGARPRPSGGRASRRRSRPGARRGRPAAGEAVVEDALGRAASASGTTSRRRTARRGQCSTPAVSAPASGCPPMKRGSSTAATSSRLVEPTSVTTHSGGGRRERLAHGAGRARAPARRRTRPTRPRARRPPSRRRARRAPRASAASSTPGAGSKPRTSAPSRSRAASPTDPPSRPTPMTATINVSDGGERLAGDRGRPLDLLEVIGEAVGVELPAGRRRSRSRDPGGSRR